MIKVSILIPIYNVEKYLRQCLDSVINQTLKDIEIICINDGSTDSSPKIINEYAEKDSRIKVINKPNSGYGHSMNQGLKLAQGEYIGIVESDDFADPNMFETLYNKAKAADIDIVKSNFWAQIGDRFLFMENLSQEPYEEVISPKLRSKTIFARQIAIWSAIYKRQFLLDNDIYFNETPGASYQDVSFHFKTTICAEKIYFLKDAFLHYRKDNPDSSMKSRSKIYCIFDEFDEIERFLSTRKDLIDPFRYALEPLKLRQCEFHFSHIDDKFKFEFFNRMYETFINHSSDEYINKDYWRENEWQAIQELFENKEKSFYRYFAMSQKSKLYVQNFFGLLKPFQNIYVYGAGKRTIMTLTRIFTWKLNNLKAIVVSSMKNNPHKIADVPVMALNEANIDHEHDVILISIKDDNQYGILYKLQADGYRNIILMTSDLVTALR